MEEVTSDARIRAALRQLWLRSRERAAALKRDEYSCTTCGVKQSKAKGREQKVEVHHKEGVLNWKELIKQIRLYLLCETDKLETQCPECHKQKTQLQ